MRYSGQKLKEAREKLNLTQKAIGARLGLEWYQIKDMESGKVEISHPIAKLLYFELRIRPEWLSVGEGPMQVDTSGIAEEQKDFGDPQIALIIKMLYDMDKEGRDDALRYLEAQKLWREKKLKEGSI